MAWTNDRAGNKNGMAKLTEAEVRSIRNAYGPFTGDMRRRKHRKKDTPTMAQIGLLFGVSSAAVQTIVSGKTWKHVK